MDASTDPVDPKKGSKTASRYGQRHIHAISRSNKAGRVQGPYAIYLAGKNSGCISAHTGFYPLLYPIWSVHVFISWLNCCALASNTRMDDGAGRAFLSTGSDLTVRVTWIVRNNRPEMSNFYWVQNGILFNIISVSYYLKNFEQRVSNTFKISKHSNRCKVDSSRMENIGKFKEQ